MRRVLFAALVAVAPMAAFSDVLVDQSPTSPDGWFSDGISTGGAQWYQQAMADDFTLATDATVSSITFWGSSENFVYADLTNFLSFDIVIYDAAFSAVFSANVATGALSPTLTGLDNSLGGHEYAMTYNTSVNLVAGSYWLHVGSVNDAPQDDAYVWSISAPGGTFGANFFDGNGWAAYPGYDDLAFRLEGTPVPEPASMAVLGLGFAALARRRRR